MSRLSLLRGRFRSGGARTAPRRAVAGGILLVLAHLGWLCLLDLRAHPSVLFALFALAAAGWVYGAGGVADLASPKLLGVLATAFVLRALLLPVPPTLSDDVYRYVWDGRVYAAGSDPYDLSPDAAELESLRDDLWEKLPHRDVATVYPPLSLWLFSIASRAPAPVFALKAALALFDLLACWLLWRLALAWRKPPGAVAWYAWNPLVTLEVAGMGHIDALGVPMVLATLLWLAPRASIGRRGLAVLTAAGGILVKLVPLLCVPVWARASRRPIRFVVGTAFVTALVGLPIMAANGVPSGLVRYGVSWEFNGPLYEPLWRTLDAVGLPTAVEAGLDTIKETTGEHELWNRFYPFNYARLQAKLLLLGVLAVAALLAIRRSDPFDATGRLFGWVVLVSATVYPWYLLWVLPWAALYRRKAWLLLSATIFLSYLPQVTEIPLMPLVYLAIWLPFFTLLWMEWRTDRAVASAERLREAGAA